MTVSKDKVLDDLTHVASGAASIFSGIRQSVREDIKSRADEMAHRLDLVPREDFERLEALVHAQEKRIQDLEKSNTAKSKK